jgi:hypothetical protein
MALPTRRSRFVRPETRRLDLSDGDWIIVKDRLTAGEQHAVYARIYVEGSDGKAHVNPLEVSRAIVVAYLVDWNLVDEHGAVVNIRGVSRDELLATLDNLDAASFREVQTAITDHDAAMTAERTQEKKVSGESRDDGTTSPSRSAAAGVSSGSVN